MATRSKGVELEHENQPPMPGQLLNLARASCKEKLKKVPVEST